MKSFLSPLNSQILLPVFIRPDPWPLLNMPRFAARGLAICACGPGDPQEERKMDGVGGDGDGGGGEIAPSLAGKWTFAPQTHGAQSIAKVLQPQVHFMCPFMLMMGFFQFFLVSSKESLLLPFFP